MQDDCDSWSKICNTFVNWYFNMRSTFWRKWIFDYILDSSNMCDSFFDVKSFNSKSCCWANLLKHSKRQRSMRQILKTEMNNIPQLSYIFCRLSQNIRNDRCLPIAIQNNILHFKPKHLLEHTYCDVTNTIII